jgi:hypothetical protein
MKIMRMLKILEKRLGNLYCKLLVNKTFKNSSAKIRKINLKKMSRFYKIKQNIGSICMEERVGIIQKMVYYCLY